MGKKEERMKIYNKGKRKWPLKDGDKDIILNPGRSIELPKTIVDKMVKNYPHDFIHGSSLETARPDLKRLMAENKNLKAENKKLKEQLKEVKTDEKPYKDNE